MGLDIYAGTLTRYYAHNWKTVTQQWAETNGFSFSRITPRGEQAVQEEEADPQEIKNAMKNWQSQILEAISPKECPPYESWTEDNETPYYTDKPDWDAFGALLLYTAARTYGEPLQETVEKSWDFENHPLIQRMGEDEDHGVWSLFIGASWWLPIADGLAFNAPCHRRGNHLLYHRRPENGAGADQHHRLECGRRNNFKLVPLRGLPGGRRDPKRKADKSRHGRTHCLQYGIPGKVCLFHLMEGR